MSPPPLGFALFGAGRIGRVHADAIAGSDRATLACVYDVDVDAAAALAGKKAGKATGAAAAGRNSSRLVAASEPPD